MIKIAYRDEALSSAGVKKNYYIGVEDELCSERPLTPNAEANKTKFNHSLTI